MSFYGSHVKTPDTNDENNKITESNKKSHVRLLLFKESGFKGRTLVFDSNMIEKPDANQSISLENSWKLSEMVFGSLSLRCHDTYFRIHKLSSPTRIMFTQVFQLSCSRKTRSSSESHASSSTLSVGTKSDLQLFQDSCNLPNSSTNNTLDSGFAEKSFSSFTISSRSSFNSDISLSRKQSVIPKVQTGSFLSDLDLYSNDSTENFSSKFSPTLGLVIILNDNEEGCSNYYLKYIHFFESVVHRIRQSIELARKKQGSLTSMMVQIYYESYEWLSRMFPKLKKADGNVQCSTSSRYFEEHDDSLKLKIASLMSIIKRPKFSLLSNAMKEKHVWQSKRIGCNDGFDGFCELLKYLDNKDRKFFASSVITATLTYHLGWVSTCFPNPSNEDNDIKTTPYNSLWRQLTELYGANGYPIKSAQTIISGPKEDEDIISKILHFIRYFIRYSSVVQNFLERIDVEKDNKTADMICQNYEAYGNYFQETEVVEPRCREAKPSLNKSKAWSANLFELSEEESSFEDNYPEQEERVTFLLGDNEELVNIKPKFMSNSTTIGTEVASSKQLDHFAQHSSSLLDDLEGSEQERSKWKENSGSEMGTNSSFISSVMHFPIQNLDITGCDDKQQTLRLKRDLKTFRKTKMKFFSFPLPKSKLNGEFETTFASSLQSDNLGKYIPDMVVQGTSIPQKEWLSKLKRNLYLERQTYFFGGYVDESVAIVGDTNTWDVEVFSSQVSMNQKATGMKLDTAPLISNMLEVLLPMWESGFCKEFSTTHIEQRLMEICIRSYAFSQFLLHTNMCTMDLLTTTLHLEVNDIPLLMSVASIIAPEVTKKYGLSYQ